MPEKEFISDLYDLDLILHEKDWKILCYQPKKSSSRGLGYGGSYYYVSHMCPNRHPYNTGTYYKVRDSTGKVPQCVDCGQSMPDGIVALWEFGDLIDHRVVVFTTGY